MQFLPQFGNVAFTLLAFVAALSIIVAVHEYGHYIVGRLTGIKAEVFSVGFGPVLLSRVDRHGTRWQIAALPFGGYVKFLGDANAASVGSSAVAARDRRHTMLGAPLWARAATVAAGPVANFILAVAVFFALALVAGRPADPLTVDAVVALPPQVEQGLRPGDQVVAIEGRPVTAETLGEVAATLPREASVAYTVRRDGSEVVVAAPNPLPPVVAAVNPDSAAWDVGIRAGDVVTAVDGEPVHAFDDLVGTVTGSGGRPLAFDVWRAGETLHFTVVPRRTDLPTDGGGFETRWLVGLSPAFLFEPDTVTPSPGEALGAAVRQLGFILISSLSGLAHMATGAISTCNLSGPVGIAEASGAMASQGWVAFLGFVAVLSAAVGLMNLFPIPVLDGGHLVFHAYEALSGRPPGDRALRVLMAAGLSAILALMLWAIANDLFLCP